MTVTLEFGTVLAGAAGLSTLSMLLLLGTWRTAGRPAYLAAWAGFCGLGSVALLLHAQRGQVPEALLILLATPAYVLALGLFWAGARRLRGAVAPAWAVALPLLPWYAACALPAVYASPAARIALATLIIALLGSAAGIELLRLRGSAGLRRAARTVGIVALLVNILPLWRIWQLLQGMPVTFNALGLLLGAMLFVATGFAGLALASALASERDARLVAAAAQREAAALQAGRAEILRLHAGLPAIIFHRDCDADGTSRLLHLGGDLAAVTGWPESDPLAAEHLADLAAPGTPAFADHLRAVLRDGSASLDWRLRQPDGSWRWMRNVGRRLSLRQDGGGEMVGYQVNIDRERAAEASAAAARAELDRTLAVAPLAVFRGRIAHDDSIARSYLSRGIETLTGFPWEHVAAHATLLEAFEVEGFGERAEVIRRLLAEGTVRLDHRVRHADGHWLEVRTTLTILGMEPDGAVEVVGFIVDVTAERQALARAAGAARLASLGEMGTGLAHELKQPLAIMSMAAENALGALGRGQVDAAMARLRRIVDQAQRAAAIIENLRRFARGGDPGAPPEPVPLERAVANALALVGGPLREAGIEVTVALGEPPPVALGQPVSVEQVLVNLLLNAADALRGLPPGGARRIRIAALASPDAPAGPMVGLTIADTGGGIPAAILPRLFEPFVSTKDAEHGTGLGLSICHGLVTSMGGAITARNAGDGALFSILLPVAMAEAPATV